MDIDKVFSNIAIKFWTCHCVERTTIKWIGDTAICESCGDTNKAKQLRIRNVALEQLIQEFLAEDVDRYESCKINSNGMPRKDCKCIQCRAFSLLQSEYKENGKCSKRQ